MTRLYGSGADVFWAPNGRRRVTLSAHICSTMSSPFEALFVPVNVDRVEGLVAVGQVQNGLAESTANEVPGLGTGIIATTIASAHGTTFDLHS